MVGCSTELDQGGRIEGVKKAIAQLVSRRLQLFEDRETERGGHRGDWRMAQMCESLLRLMVEWISRLV